MHHAGVSGMGGQGFVPQTQVAMEKAAELRRFIGRRCLISDEKPTYQYQPVW